MMNAQEQTGRAGVMPTVAAHPAASAETGRLRLALRVCGFVALAIGVLFAGGFGWFADKVSHMTTPVDPARADAIVVLTGGQSRLDAAMDLLASGKGKRLLVSGVHPSASRHQLQVAMGGDKQLFSCCVDIDRAALDTIGNAEESAKWVENHAYGSIIVVTNNYHMPRSLLEMSRLLHGARLEPYPVVNTNLGNGGWLTKPEALRVLLTEYSKYVLALARGFLPPRATPDGTTLADAAAVSSVKPEHVTP
ncbi:YdcF family protein [Mesorhizobium sp. CU2]|uniref:YdcF family protein n=1 Tax=unclassified Mesorhizobium TaxID=325217 RepID=UPI00112C3F0A|nr:MULTISPECIES: YdcF family protein [unclassified Mesorhizobium]TPN76883.1 YdcF family protein [Mesorhizobium sp. CU3]TPO20929.1 YdcF family protein [Mesorhizobium sp. CU2]